MTQGNDTNLGPNPSGLCMCGCGRRTTITTKTDAKRGTRAGQPARYLVGHNAKSNAEGKHKMCITCRRSLPWDHFDRYERNRVRYGSCRQCRAERARDTSVPADRIDPGFGNWLAGFIDGEGSFVIATSNGQFRCMFSLAVRDDDFEVIREVAERTGIGSIGRRRRYAANHNPTVVWTVTSIRDCVALVRILDRFPLRAKKRRDYAVWRRAVLHWETRPVGSHWHGTVDWHEFAALKRELEAVRVYQPPAVDLPTTR